MKKIFLFMFVFLCFSATCLAQRVDVKATDNYHTITLLKAKVLKYNINDTSKERVDFVYDADDKSLYVLAHSQPDGILYLQNAGETLEKCINRILDANSALFSNIKVNKVILAACYESERHENRKDISIGYANSLNALIEELAYADSKLDTPCHISKSDIKLVMYTGYCTENKDFKLAKKVAKESGAQWAIPVLDDLMTKKL